MKPKIEAQDFLNKLEGLDLKGEVFFDEETNTKNTAIYLPKSTNESFSSLQNPSKDISSPTALILPGSGLSYTAYKGLAVDYLLEGINVMMVDFRGYGKSTGSPTSYKTKLDAETAYQYLIVEKKVKNSEILVHGHCLGGGSATDLAARRKDVNLLLT